MVNGYRIRFRAGEGEDVEEEEWYLSLVKPLPVQVGSSTATPLTAINDSGTTFSFPPSAATTCNSFHSI